MRPRPLTTTEAIHSLLAPTKLPRRIVTDREQTLHCDDCGRGRHVVYAWWPRDSFLRLLCGACWLAVSATEAT